MTTIRANEFSHAEIALRKRANIIARVLECAWGQAHGCQCATCGHISQQCNSMQCGHCNDCNVWQFWGQQLYK